ncbi:alcohol dehydrogenase [Grosmannia clavigera kw1407]|uniref:Alcohol dehydrogenase n=1 Tax=Grosmannia clavigera (strain kw1407 / UAMH 11150) TaxID=655863 RepID=F0X7A0_GROCL|nr:alcohol dehydrogenase [Grosmannia clavigera kw1407]EFX06291.1 alcohol dehydrogenase [Grosmannia clavigera kw1407]
MSNMADQMDVWALTEWDKPLQKMRLPKPTLQGRDVLLRVTHAGVCHSDLHTAEGFYDVGKGQRFYVKDRGITLPRALGHEICGEVVAVGPDVAAGSLAVGSRQIVYPWLGCAACTRCRQEEDNLCAAQRGLGTLQHGGFAEYVVVPDPKYLVDLGSLDPAVACTFGCSGITTLSAVGKVMPLPPDEPVLLIGAGGLGLAAISVLRSYGHRAIVSADISDEKLDGARAAGASQTVNTAGPDAATKILAATGGPVLAVIDFVNSSATAALVNGLVAKGAKWVQVGVMGGSLELSLVGNIFKGLTISSNITGNLADLHALVKMAKDGKLAPVPVQKMDWNDVNEAMGLLKAGKVTGRVVLVK